MFILLSIIIIVLILLCFLLKPAKPANAKMEPFYHRNFAHRGLHTKDHSIPENSLTAFQAAVDHGYGIELDIQFSKDRQVVVFHDDTLQRVCGITGRVDDYTYEELKKFSLCESKERIPLFSEVLSVVGGKVPLIVELKTGPHNKELCEKGYALLKAYSGPYCIESFDPGIVHWFSQNAPQILRGQLSAPPKSLSSELPWYQAVILGNVLSNVAARPNFIAYDKARLPFLVRCAYSLGAMRFVWTVRDSDDTRSKELKNDAVIFEFYEPTVYFD